MQHAALGDDDDVLHRGVLTVSDHFFGRADLVCQQSHGLGAFRMGDDESGGILGFDPVDGIAGELDMDVAIALPEVHFAASLLHDPRTEVFVGDEENRAVLGCLVDDFYRISGGADDVAEGFDAARAVDVGDDVVVFRGVGGEEGFEFRGGAGLLERAASVGIGQDDDFPGVYDFRRFRHEMDAAEDDDIGLGGLGVVGEAERVADVICDVLDVAGLVIMGEDDGVPGLFQGEDFLLEIECSRHLERRVGSGLMKLDGLGDHFNGAGVFGAGLDDERGGADEALEVGTLFEGDGPGAVNLAADVAIDEGGGGVDGIEELDAGALFHSEVPAIHLADDFTVAADDEVS